MMRRLFAAVAVLFLSVGLLFAAELKGTVGKVNAEKNTIQVKGENAKKARNFRVSDQTKIVDADEKEIKLEDVKEGATVTVTYEGKGKETKVSKIKVEK